MKAEICHTKETIHRLSKVQYHTFRPGVRLLWVILGLGCVLWAMACGEQLLFYILMLAGCWLVTNLELPAKHRADKIIASGKGKLPHTRYRFGDAGIQIRSGEYQKDLPWKAVYALLEDEGYFYVFLNREAGYMVDKATLEPSDPAALRKLLEEKTGQKFRKPTTLWNLNLRRLWGKK